MKQLSQSHSARKSLRQHSNPGSPALKSPLPVMLYAASFPAINLIKQQNWPSTKMMKFTSLENLKYRFFFKTNLLLEAKEGPDDHSMLLPLRCTFFHYFIYSFITLQRTKKHILI